ncbi:MAG: hypothetical protein JRJ19_05050, partial [Deltaproteobacteria bacterium]|nr:hypothetical protein [Deltaproteobacteria bacterium]
MIVRNRYMFVVVLAAGLLLIAGCSSSSEEPDGSIESDGQDGQQVNDEDQQDGTPGADDAGSNPDDDQPQDGAGDPNGDSGSDEDLDGGDSSGPTIIGTLSVDCDVPFVLDASQVTSMAYMTSHFDDLVQAYCITTTVGGVDITSYAEKMYYGSHSAAGTPAADVVLSLNQQSMTGLMAPAY